MNEFEESRNLIIASFFDCVNKCPNKSLSLNARLDYRISESEECVIAQKYKRVYIKNDTLMIEYEYGEGFEPYEYESVTEDIEVLSSNEIYEIITRIKE